MNYAMPHSGRRGRPGVLEHAATLGDDHVPQVGSAHGAGVVENVGEVQPAAAGGADEVAGDGINELGLLA